jgi:voltage-gated potassium channel Kch
MLKNENEAWILLLIIIAIFLHHMLRLVVGHSLQPTIVTISIHMNHVHIVSFLIIMLVIV